MLIFEKLRWKNFLSTGNAWTEIDFLSNKSTLIVGHNGAGKSTILDALSFALFGKPHRNINKPQLVNSINKKNCVVEVEFKADRTNLRIVRGLNPAIFEIWKNGVMINQDSHAREYQKILEQNILKLTHKSFHQIVVLGSSSFIPFMQLAAHHRRSVIEDLLDINVFTKMNLIIKEKISLLRDRQKDNAYQIELNTNKIDTQNKYIRNITALNDEEVREKQSQIDSILGEIERLESLNLDLLEGLNEAENDASKKLNLEHDRKQSLLQYKAGFDTKIRSLVKDAKFYEDNTSCPTCTQEILEDTRTTKLESVKEKAMVLQDAMKKIQEQSSIVEDSIRSFNSLIENLRKKRSEMSANDQDIRTRRNMITTLKDDIRRINSRSGDLGLAQIDLENMKSEREELREEKFKLNESHNYNSVIAEMLKDTGIKTKVIKQYLPVINKLVNQYLQVLDFFVHFNLDEEFKEQIRSRHRDTFSYDSFSEGEKQRIDLALLFTWRMIAKMKNSVATNLLILDETFDSSLDHEGVDNLMKILHTLDEDTNVFVISHKGEILDGKFQRKVEFHKEKNFSVMLK